MFGQGTVGFERVAPIKVDVRPLHDILQQMPTGAMWTSSSSCAAPVRLSWMLGACVTIVDIIKLDKNRNARIVRDAHARHWDGPGHWARG